MEEGSKKTGEALAGRGRHRLGLQKQDTWARKGGLYPRAIGRLWRGGGPVQTPCRVGCNGVDLATGWMPGLRRAWEGGRSCELS